MLKRLSLLPCFICLCGIAQAQVEHSALRDSLAKTRQAVRALQEQLAAKKAALRALQEKMHARNWKLTGDQRLMFNQVAFDHWAAGGDNSLALSARLDYRLRYRKGIHAWHSRLSLAYGLRNTLGQGTQKTDDALHLSSRYDCQYTENTSWGAFLDFQTQFDKGYNPAVNPTQYSARFMAPAYLKTGPTFGYRLRKAFYLNLSFAALKLNVVLDDALSQRGAYGVQPGEKVLTQLGANLNANYQVAVCQNVKAENRLSLYADYLRSFGNIDVNDDLLLTLRINAYLSAQFTLGLRYDDDTAVPIGKSGDETLYGKRLQLKQSLGIGLTYRFAK